MIKGIQIKCCPPYGESGGELTDCKKVNFIYGANGSGKTTISEFLRAKDIEGRYNSCEIDWGIGGELPIFVYNRQFRQLNFAQETGIPGVFTLGQNSIKDLEAIQKLKEDLSQKEERYNKTKESIEKKENEKARLQEDFKEDAWQQIFKNHERDFGEAFEGVRGSKNKFIQALQYRHNNPKGNLTDKENLLDRANSLFKRKPFKANLLHTISKTESDEVNRICSEKIWSLVIIGSQDVEISKLIKNLDNSSWVHEGIRYLDPEKNICPFCQKNTIDQEFRLQLSSFFDESYTKNIELMNSKKLELENLVNSILEKLKENIRKKDDCQIGQLNLETYQALIGQFEAKYENAVNNINEKIKIPEKRIDLPELQAIINEITNLLLNANSIIEKNNQLVDKFKEESESLVDDVWTYCIEEAKTLLTIFEKKQNDIEKAIAGMKTSNKNTYAQILEIKKEIKEKSEKLTSVQPAVDQINNILKAYGLTSFYLEPYSEIPGEQENKYRIIREDGSEATHTLSEGEATFITFLYFMQLTRGALDKDEVQSNKIIVLDDPISSLDSSILYLVSAMVKELVKNIKEETSDVKQLFIFTHNVYFHKEASFIDGRTCEDKDVNYWIVRKNNGISKIYGYGMQNPISSTYELLWKELREDERISLVSMQNIMRRIIENYFKITGQKPSDYILSKFTTQEEKVICESLLYWINDGSHTIYDDLNVDSYSNNINIFKTVFRDIFEKTGHIAHYNMMMGSENETIVQTE